MLRVLAWPAGRESDLNPYVRLMQQAFVRPDAIVLPYTPRPWPRTVADVFHIQWPEAIFEGRGGGVPGLAHLKAMLVLRAASRIRRDGGFVALTLHNLDAHATLSTWQRRLYARFQKALLRRTDLLVAMSNATLAEYRSVHPTADSIRAALIPHPHYKGIYPSPARQDARTRLELALGDARLVVIAGSLRPSKRTPAAIRAFRDTNLSAFLLVAGEAEDAHWQEIVRAAANDERVVLRRGRLSVAALADVITAADAVLVNQTTTLNSGTALLALSFGRPVIAPATGSLPELAAIVGNQWIRLFESPLAPEALKEFVRISLPKDALPNLDAFDPQTLSRRLLDAFVEFAQPIPAA